MGALKTLLEIPHLPLCRIFFVFFMLCGSQILKLYNGCVGHLNFAWSQLGGLNLWSTCNKEDRNSDT